MCPLHHSAGCDCRFVIESLLFTGLVLFGVAWLVGDKARHALREAFR
jgi:hypothetical protein